MERETVDLSLFENRSKQDYSIGRPLTIQLLWFFAGLPLLRCAVISSSGFRVWLLRCFGARIGQGVVIKPGVRVKFPWKLTVGDHTWLGEDCWIDNLVEVRLGSHVCLSQGVYLCTGSHDWTSRTFDLITRSIEIRDGVWVGAKACVAPGAHLGEHSVVGINSTVKGCVPAYEIYMGNPAMFVKRRQILPPVS